jgi:hypothetical protein
MPGRDPWGRGRKFYYTPSPHILSNDFFKKVAQNFSHNFVHFSILQKEKNFSIIIIVKGMALEKQKGESWCPSVSTKY